MHVGEILGQSNEGIQSFYYLIYCDKKEKNNPNEML